MLKDNGYKIFKQIVDKINNLEDFEIVYNNNGFNFLHGLV